MTYTVTWSQSCTAPSGCGGLGDLHHGCAAAIVSTSSTVFAALRRCSCLWFSGSICDTKGWARYVLALLNPVLRTRVKYIIVIYYYTCSRCSSLHDWQFAWLCWWGGHRVTAQCRAVSSLVTGLSSLGWSYFSLWLCSPLFLGSTLSSVEAKLAHTVNILHWAAAVKKEELSLSWPSHLLTWYNFRGTSEHRLLFLSFSQICKTSPWSCWSIISEALEVLGGWSCSLFLIFMLWPFIQLAPKSETFLLRHSLRKNK